MKINLKINKKLSIFIGYTIYLICILGILGIFCDNNILLQTSRLVTCTYGLLGIGGLIFAIVINIRSCVKSKSFSIADAFILFLCFVLPFLIIGVHSIWNNSSLGNIYNLLNLDKLNIIEFSGVMFMFALLVMGMASIIEILFRKFILSKMKKI